MLVIARVYPRIHLHTNTYVRVHQVYEIYNLNVVRLPVPVPVSVLLTNTLAHSQQQRMAMRNDHDDDNDVGDDAADGTAADAVITFYWRAKMF